MPAVATHEGLCIYISRKRHRPSDERASAAPSTAIFRVRAFAAPARPDEREAPPGHFCGADFTKEARQMLWRAPARSDRRFYFDALRAPAAHISHDFIPRQRQRRAISRRCLHFDAIIDFAFGQPHADTNYFYPRGSSARSPCQPDARRGIDFRRKRHSLSFIGCQRARHAEVITRIRPLADAEAIGINNKERFLSASSVGDAFSAQGGSGRRLKRRGIIAMPEPVLDNKICRRYGHAECAAIHKAYHRAQPGSSGRWICLLSRSVYCNAFTICFLADAMAGRYHATAMHAAMAKP